MQTIANLATGDSREARILAEIRAKAAQCPETMAELDERQRAARRAARRDYLRVRCGLEGDMLTRSLATYPATEPSQVEAVDLLRQLVREMIQRPRIVPKRGVCLCGDTGVAKSGLFHGMMNDIIDADPPPGDWDMLIVPCGDPTALQALMQSVNVAYVCREARLVLLDDIEKGLDVPEARFRSPEDKLIRGIVTSAERTGTPCVCATSNFALEQHRKRWGNAWGSKLGAVSHWHRLTGADLRPRGEEKPPWYVDL